MKSHHAVAIACLLLGLAAAAVGEDAALPTVVPAPRHMDWATDQPAWLAAAGLTGVVMTPECPDLSGGLDQIHARRATLGLGPLEIAGVWNNGAIRVGLEPCADLDAVVADLPAPGAEGYRLMVTERDVVIVGKDARGLYYGMVTLSRLIDDQGRIPRVAVSDWPDFGLRGTYIAGRDDAAKRIPEFAALKYNLVLFESGDLYELDNPDVRQAWQDVFALCRRHFIEPVPELQSLGWGHHILLQEPRAVEAVYVEQMPFIVQGGRIASPDLPIPPALEVVNPGFEKIEDGKPAGWLMEGFGELSFVEKAGAHDGDACIRLHREETGIVRAWCDVDCLAGQRYEASCHMKIENIEGGGAYIEVYGLLDGGQLGRLIGTGTWRRGTSDWAREVTPFDSGEYTRARIYVRIQDATGTAWFDDVAVVGIQPPNPLANVIVTEAAPVIVQDASGAITYEEGKDYRVLPPDTRYPYDNNSPLEIEVPEQSRLGDGDTVLLSFQYAPRDSITCCPSEPLYQEFMRHAVHNAINYLKPKYVHIGHDEPRLMNRDKRCHDRGMTNSELFVDDIKKMREYAIEADPKVRIMMWDDAVNPYQNGPMLGMSDAAPMIPKDVVMCIWWYDERDVDRQLEESTKYFLGLGFDVTGSPWFNPKNAYQWAETLHRHRKGNAHVLGGLYTSWAHSVMDPWGALDTFAEYCWTFEKPAFEP
ncbi:MAG TPA: glycoside hydrolase family 20 zincin-like fold domain-containing protein [Candidatus Hydrogenedentes bacterium]|nr:glycoside hydrolase family 20 zincin-like fold domain-containing protein [Candidatus Hydrogenedentota bacterium]HPG68256.1 glycoside hydrolase family 20 zincin-like fold domain-containing protein [Candidatus Hydrogenedentota bacterium]